MSIMSKGIYMMKNNLIKARGFHIVTKQSYLSEDKIKNVLNRYKTITSWAYILHDKEIDEVGCGEDSDDGLKKFKDAHWHIAIYCKDNRIPLSSVASWFGIGDNFIDKSEGSIIYIIKYMLHEDEESVRLNKHRYDDSELKTNINFRNELNHISKKKKREYFFTGVLNGMHPDECREIDRYFYAENMDKLIRLYKDYLNHKPVPSTRYNIYIYGDSSSGKDCFAKALARAIYNNKSKDEYIYHTIGSPKTMFENYLQQEVIIWNDMRAESLLSRFNNDIGLIYNIFDVHPSAISVNVKYSSIKLTNRINIVHSVQPYDEFLDTLSGNEDRRQSYRRFPIIIHLKEDTYDVFINKFFMDRTESFTEYYRKIDIPGSFGKYRILYSSEEAHQKEQRAIKPVVDIYNDIRNKIEHIV